MEKDIDKIEDVLLRKIDVTSIIRHCAAKRLTLHAWASQWTLALLAVGQIVIGLLVALKFDLRYKENYVIFGTVFFSVLVLTYSLLLGMSNFSVRAAKFHECALSLGKHAMMVREYVHYGIKNSERMQEFIHKHKRILSISENHTQSDYIRYKIKYNKATNTDFISYFIRVSLQFSHYFISILVMYIWIIFLVIPKN